MAPSDVQELAAKIAAACSTNISTDEVWAIIGPIVENATIEEAEFIEQAAFAIDIERGGLQEEYEDEVIASGGFVVEHDGVVYGYTASGDAI